MQGKACSSRCTFGDLFEATRCLVDDPDGGVLAMAAWENADGSVQEEQPKVSAVLGALLWIAFRTRPDVCWAVTRVTTAQDANKTPEQVEDEARVRIRHLMQYLASTWNWALIFRPVSQEKLPLMWFAGDASFAPSGGKSHEGSTIFHGCTSHDRSCGNLVHWRSSKQHLVSLSSCEAELIAMVSTTTVGIGLSQALGEMLQQDPVLELSSDNSAAITLVKSGPLASFRTRHISIRGFYLHYVVERGLVEVSFASTKEQPTDALTKGMAACQIGSVRNQLRLDASVRE